MAHPDYETAWRELGKFIRSKTGHGSNDLIVKMSEIEAACEGPEDLLQRAFRLHGGALQIKPISEEGTPVLAVLRTGESKPTDPEPSSAQGGHDERDETEGRDPPRGRGRERHRDDHAVALSE